MRFKILVWFCDRPLRCTYEFWSPGLLIRTNVCLRQLILTLLIGIYLKYIYIYISCTALLSCLAFLPPPPSVHLSHRIHANPLPSDKHPDTMKCFSDFGSCYRRPVTRSAPSVEAGDAFSPPLETRGDSGSRRRRRLKSGAASHWRPRLTAISEDVVAPADEMRTERLRKKSASKRGSSDRSYSYSFSHAEEYDQGYQFNLLLFYLFSSSYICNSIVWTASLVLSSRAWLWFFFSVPYRPNSMSMVMPMFSPTPFMFWGQLLTRRNRSIAVLFYLRCHSNSSVDCIAALVVVGGGWLEIGCLRFVNSCCNPNEFGRDGSSGL